MDRPLDSQGNSKPKHSSPNDLTKFIIKHEPDYPAAGGGHALVYKCTYMRGDHPVGVPVAVKMVLTLPGIEEEALWREIGIWKRMRHDCIVPLLGTTTYYSPVSIVSSWMPNGTLQSYLKQDKRSPKEKYNLLYNVADGLHYLHSESVVHGDLASHNVLINENGQACLTDFGLSSMTKAGEKFRYLRLNEKRPGDWNWSAPELMQDDGLDNSEDGGRYVPSPFSDIYSYGCIIYEVLSDVLHPLPLFVILAGNTPVRPKSEHMHDEDWIFVLQCWLSLPSLRPLASQALRFARTRLSVYQDQAESYGTSISTYSAHLVGANICNLSSLVRSHPRPAFSDPAICWKSIDKLAEALIALFTAKRYQHGLDDAIQLYHVSLAALTPSSTCMTSSLRKISSVISPNCTERSDAGVRDEIERIMGPPDAGDPIHFTGFSYLSLHAIAEHMTNPDLDILSRAKSWYRESFRNTTSDILCRLQTALACARIAENINDAAFSLEAYETSLELLQEHVSATSITAWAEPVEHLSTSIAVDAAAAALHLGDVNKAVELLEWGRELLRTYIVRSQTSEKHISEMDFMPSGCPRPSFSDLLKAMQGGPVVMLIASRRSCDAIIVSSAHSKALHVPLKTISLSSLAELSITFNACTSSVSGNSESVEQKLKDALRSMWVDVVAPVMNHLENLPTNSRIWWCPTSAFSTLPVHAAGEYTSNGKRLLRLHVSSYTSSIISLLRAQRTCTDPGRLNSFSEFAAIYVAKPIQKDEQKEAEHLEIESGGLEPDLVKCRLPASLYFTRFRDATKEDAYEALKNHGWFHLMAYLTQNACQPLNSSFLMLDGLLSIPDIIQADLGPKEFAFLSARPIGSQLSWMQNEVVQFAAGLEISGFKSVVGMMGNVDGSIIIDKFYRALFCAEPPDCTRAARALHDVLEEMANSETGLSLEDRIAFAHFGL